MLIIEHKQQICPQCDYQNDSHSKFCIMCGHYLPGNRVETRGLPEIADAEMLVPAEKNGAALTPSQKYLRLQVEGYVDPRIIDLPVGKTIVLGRSARSGEMLYDELVTLDDYAAYLKGVSRNHLLLRRTATALSIVDLGSRNGTFIKGKKLKAFEPYSSAEIDELQLGYLNIRLSLQTHQSDHH